MSEITKVTSSLARSLPLVTFRGQNSHYETGFALAAAAA
jgi:hypothetical protein